MRNKLRALMAGPGRRYIVIGGSVYLIELLVIVVAQWLGASPVVAVSFSFWIGLCLSFGLQKIVTFRDKRMQHQILARQVLAYSLLVIFNFLFTVAVAKILSPHIPAVASRTVALAITTIWNYYLYKTRIFNTAEGLIY